LEGPIGEFHVPLGFVQESKCLVDEDVDPIGVKLGRILVVFQPFGASKTADINLVPLIRARVQTKGLVPIHLSQPTVIIRDR